MAEDDVPPAAQSALIGHREAERALVAALSGRLHHAWLITGPKGVGKATLAYRFARKILADAQDGPPSAGLFGEPEPATSLYVPPEHPAFQRVTTGAHGDLLVIERIEDAKTGRMREEIPVDEVRRLNRFFGLTGAETGRRIAIVDSVDELNRNGANALLKILEEPPRDALLLLVAHRPGRILPTIRSRCRVLALKPLAEAEIDRALKEMRPGLGEAERRRILPLAAGSIGRALDLSSEEGRAVLADFERLLEGIARAPARDIHAFADRVTGRDGEERYRIFLDLLRAELVSRTAHEADDKSGGGARPRLDQWFQVWEKVSHLSERADAVHLDRKQVTLTLLLDMQMLLRREAAL
jgi:DNA polymerase-3 subunit delta'